MTFWILAALMSLAAAAFLIVPSLIKGRETHGDDRKLANLGIFEERVADYDNQLAQQEITQAEYDVFVLELKRNLLTESSAKHDEKTALDVANEQHERTKLPLVLAVLVPLFSVWAYADFGLSWGSINDVALAESIQEQSPHDQDAMSENVETLAKRLKNQPDNHEGWYMLGRSYLSMGKFEESAAAFAHMLETFDEDHSLAAYHAEALYMADERVVTPRVAAAIETTLAMNPHDITMLEIKALGAFQRQDMRGAIEIFQRALAAGAEGERADMINRAIIRIQADLGDAPMMEEVPLDELEPSSETVTESVAAGDGRTIQVLVEVADSVNMPGSTPVFVFARAMSGPPMPLAVQRMTRADLPQLITLDESMAMMQGMGLANFDQVQVVARISASGIANAGPQDYQALSGAIDLTQKVEVIKLNISKQVKDF